ncbi:MAG: aminotransferase class V-fold PLP-dependent enzyme [Syntrophales bacterium]|nr:aminotransferase class V-fold PLP-dependent enzyme [Syntrophales bacterium]
MDYGATTPVDAEVVTAMLPFFTEAFGNPSSFHAFGQEAKYGVEAARQTIAASIGTDPEEIVFTSGGSESDNFAVKGVAYAKRRREITSLPQRLSTMPFWSPVIFWRNKVSR